MSGEQRLPDAIPADGSKGGTVEIVAAKGEYEPGSFVVRADSDLGKVNFSVGVLTNEAGVAFPADKIDLKVIKVWYQNKNGWFSFFSDSGAKLCPELLLNDEELIRVDANRQANYARVVGPDGKKTDWWLNPPRLMNRRYYDHNRESFAFQSMRPGFSDAPTLQPVELAKDVSKQFFLTVHVTPDIPSGLYQGKIEAKGGGGRWNIPVVVRVLDFELPRPMAYLRPEQDFRICFYSYVMPDLIMKENGGDSELAWRQMEAILSNAVAHGQNSKRLVDGRTGTADNVRLIELMKKVGMRTDYFIGGVDFVWRETSLENAAARAYRIADYYDRTYGHHNVYCDYGDEPNGYFLPSNRAVFDGYTSAGLEFFIAGRKHVLSQVGYKWGWHNMSCKATDGRMPVLWSQMGPQVRCAWYGDQHVGAENPELARRQNGLAAYLSGFNALCNYAHHLGPYNDDSEYYKPMVFAYGTASGVIDTLQWEGFREGVDDIRYATLLMALAREAETSEDVSVRHLAGKAKQMFVLFDREKDDLNMARLEMISHIERLRRALRGNFKRMFAVQVPQKTARAPLPALARPVPAEKPATNVAEARKIADEWMSRNDLDKAVAAYAPIVENPKMPPWIKTSAQRDVAALYAKFYLFDKQVAYLKDCGLTLDAAKAMLERFPERADEAYGLVEAKIEVAAKSGDRARFPEMWKFLLSADRPAAERHLDAALKIMGTAAVADAYLVAASGLSVAYNGNWPRMLRYYDAALKVDAGNTNRLWAFKSVQYAVSAYLQNGDVGKLVRYCDLGLATAARGDKRCAYKPEEVYFLNLAKAVCGNPNVPVEKALEDADAEFGKGLAPQVRKDRIERLASFAMCANDERFVRAAAAFLDKIFVPKQDKTYVVKFSPRRILGLGGWDAVAREVKPGTESLDRPYGGDTSCLWTDVSTGRGEVHQDPTKKYARNPEWQAMADEWGIHFRLEVFDEQVKEIAAGSLSAGSLEGYIAPGENTPYHCLLHTFEPGGFSVYNGVYDQKDHRMIDAKDRVNCREDVAYTDGSIIIYWAFSWNLYATRIPTAESVWDFEPMFWGRKSCLSWNGLKTIHGRSSWGHLRFSLTGEDRLAILRPVIIRTKLNYQDEKSTMGDHDGLVSHWLNAEVGDPAFYKSVLKPLIERLDSAAGRVDVSMDAETVDELERHALPLWYNFRYETQRLRADYLRKRVVDQIEARASGACGQ